MLDSTIELDRPAVAGTPKTLDGLAADPPRVPRGEPLLRWLAATLDEVDYGMLLVAEDSQVIHVNRAACADLDTGHPLQLLGRQVRARHSKDVAPLQEALASAAERGLRKLLRLGVDGGAVSISIVPLGAPRRGERTATLLMLGKRQVCAELSVEGYARTHGLTPAETRVLVALCSERGPSEAAARLGVAISTVRTQIGMIRMKTGAPSIRELLRQIAALPPLMSVLRLGGNAEQREARLAQCA